MSELSRLRGSEGYGACSDDAGRNAGESPWIPVGDALGEAGTEFPVSPSMFRTAEWETRSGLPQDRRRSPQGGRSKHYDDEVSSGPASRLE